MEKLVLIDGNAVIHRAYHSMPKTLSTRKGEPTNAVYGFAVTLIKVLEDLRPEYIAATFDLAGPTFRHEVYTEYKATRVKADQDLYDQIPRVKQLVTAFGIPIYELQGFEADDCLGTIVQKIQDTRNNNQANSKSGLCCHSGLDPESIGMDSCLRRNDETDAKKLTPNAYNLDVYIVSGDKDIFQLINDNVKVYNLKKGLSQTQIVDEKVIQDEYNLQPSDFIDLKALAGDPSDNIPGVPGIGPKTATELIQKFDTLDKLYEAIEKNYYNSHPESNEGSSKYCLEDSHGVTSGRLRQNVQNNIISIDALDSVAKELGLKPRTLKLLIEHKDQAFLSQHLATIHKDVPIEFDLDKCRVGQYDKEGLRVLFEELGFQSLLRRFGGYQEIEKSTKLETPTEVQKRDEQLKLL